jgi:5'-AMP-activated protein kinase catalytic alpha subunit
MVEFIERGGRLQEEEARKYFRQLVSAMDHAHTANVVHRDLKVDNLLLDDRKNLLISDFGLGRTFNPAAVEYMQTFCGTPNYAPVELISGVPYNGVQAEIWSMGVVLFNLTSGRFPFTGVTISTLYRNIQEINYRIPEHFSPGLGF